MKTLLLLRHGKSSWKNSTLADHERPLKARGRRDAPKMGRWLAQKTLVPDLMISSTARRARQTAVAVASAAGYEGEIQYAASLYETDASGVFELVREIEGSAQRVLIVSHQPELQAVIEVLAGKEAKMPTCALAHLRLKIKSWSEIDEGIDAKLVDLWRPKALD
jgi:phosphohistidine phosphatase